jgi:hypothetical protein
VRIQHWQLSNGACRAKLTVGTGQGTGRWHLPSGGVYGHCDDLFDSKHSLWFGRSGDFPTSSLVGSAELKASEDVFVKPGFNFNMETRYDGTGGTVSDPGDEYE